ncbi:MAG: IclR family transcriptional regulator [Salinibacterium amurskyense]
MTQQPRLEAPASQTLSRGIRILELLAEATRALSIDDVASQLSVHRSVAYRLIRTLESHRLVERSAEGYLQLGVGLAALATGVARDLHSAALPELTAAANDLGVTCFIATLDHDECVTLASVEARNTVATVAQQPGTRHPVTVGAPGKAILMQLAEYEWPENSTAEQRSAVGAAIQQGWAESQNEVISHLRSVAVPLRLRGRAPATLAAVYLTSSSDTSAIAARLTASAAAIREALDGISA